MLESSLKKWKLKKKNGGAKKLLFYKPTSKIKIKINFSDVGPCETAESVLISFVDKIRIFYQKKKKRKKKKRKKR